MSEERGDWVELPAKTGETHYARADRCRVEARGENGKVVVHTEGDAIALVPKARRDMVLAALDGNEAARAALAELCDAASHGRMPVWQVVAVGGAILAGLVLYATRSLWGG